VGANAIVSAALAHARELGIPEAIAVYDESDVLKALVSMDGARVTSVNVALDKAYTAARRQAATQDLADAMASAPEVTWHSFLKQPRLTLLGGGIPIVVNGQVVGGTGASGGSIAQAIEVAKRRPGRRSALGGVDPALKETAVRDVCFGRLYRPIAEATLLIGGSTGRSGSHIVKFSPSCSKRMVLHGGFRLVRFVMQEFESRSHSTNIVTLGE
jgi:uncharacterized protein GlcG (DUF336 family)